MEDAHSRLPLGIEDPVLARLLRHTPANRCVKREIQSLLRRKGQKIDSSELLELSSSTLKCD